MTSRGLWRQFRAYATAVDHALPAKRARAQAHIASVDARNDIRVSPTLMDSFGRGHDYLRISLTERCNLRCTYCMPSEGVDLAPKEDLLTNDEVIRLARLFVRQGISKIRLTGGEPTLRKDLVGLIGHLHGFGALKSIGMTSNGIALARKLPELVRAGLTGLNLSLDTLDPLKFELLTRRKGHSAVLTSLETALSLLPPPGIEPVAGQHLSNVKLNVVVIRGVNDAEVANFAQLARDKRVEVRFIEYMPFDDNAWASHKLIPSADLLAHLHSAVSDLMPRSGHASDTSRTYAAPHWQGSVGFISSMTDHFCAGCSRLRLGADGGFKVCLFGPPKVNLRQHLRSGATDHQLLTVIGEAIQGKAFAHNGSSSGSVRNCKESQCSNGQDRRLICAPGHISRYLLAQRSMAFSARRDLSTATHIDEEGRPKMVDVGDKPVTKRTATAVGSIWVNDEALNVLKAVQASKKGDVLTVAQVAGMMAAKNASMLIPLCHPLLLDRVDVQLALVEEQKRIDVYARVHCEGKTGVEMEALTAVSTTCLTLWDMLKAVAGKDMRIGGILVVEKTGSRSGNWRRENPVEN